MRTIRIDVCKSYLRDHRYSRKNVQNINELDALFVLLARTSRGDAGITETPCLRINETRSFVVGLSRVIDNYSSRRVASRNVYHVGFSVA